MAPILLFNHNTGGVTMAMNSKKNEQISFDDLKCEGGFEEEFRTVTGKEQMYVPEFEVYRNYECNVGDFLTGYPEVSIIPKKDKSYDSLKVRIIDEAGEEVLEAYAYFPKANDKGFVKRIGKSFDFYRNAFDFIYSLRKCKGEKYILDKNGEEYTEWNNIDFIGHAKLLDQMSKVTITITEGNPDSDFDSWEITEME